MAREMDIWQKPDFWKKGLIIGGAVLGGFVAWRFASPGHPGLEIVLGVMLGALVASLVWDFSDDESCDDESCDQESCGQKFRSLVIRRRVRVNPDH